MTGPVFSRRGYLLYCDASANKILKSQDGVVTTYRESSNGARCLTFDHQGCLLVCEKDRVTRIEKNGKATVLASVKDPFDGIFAVDGHTYFCDGKAVYLDKAVATRECEHPVGVALSGRQQTLYVTDGSLIRSFPIDAKGALGKGRVFATATAGGLGGIKTSEDGRVWVASPSGIQVFSPEGKLIEILAVPEAPNNLNWGEGFRNLYVTTKTSVQKLEVKANGTRTY